MTLKDYDRNEMIKLHMEKAEKNLKSAVLLSETDDYDSAANRAYYSVFHAESALLLTKGILGDSHKHVHNSISKEFVISKELSVDIFRTITKVQSLRNIGDYSRERSVTKEEMEEAISIAKDFLDITKELITKTT